MLSESAGRLVLKEAFEAQGYQILEDFPFQWQSLDVVLDGYDPHAKVGYEYLTAHDGLAPHALDQLMRQSDCALFLIDESQVPDAQAMVQAVFEFFRQIEPSD